jgi:hypothetical protein
VDTRQWRTRCAPAEAPPSNGRLRAPRKASASVAFWLRGGSFAGFHDVFPGT